MLKKVYSAIVASAMAFAMISTVAAQRPRPVNDDETQTIPSPAPATVKAKYEGGVFGIPDKKTGTLTLDVLNDRLLFSDGKQKELFSIPFDAITGAYGDTHKVKPAAASVIEHVPFGLPAKFVRTKVRYLTVQYSDRNSNVSGVTSFRLETKGILESVLYSLAAHAGLSKHGDIYTRKQER